MAKSEHTSRSQDSNKMESPRTFKDPVCGMEVTTPKSYSVTHGGTEFRFCSLSCLEKFKADPDSFIEC